MSKEIKVHPEVVKFLEQHGQLIEFGGYQFRYVSAFYRKLDETTIDVVEVTTIPKYITEWIAKTQSSNIDVKTLK